MGASLAFMNCCLSGSLAREWKYPSARSLMMTKAVKVVMIDTPESFTKITEASAASSMQKMMKNLAKDNRIADLWLVKL